MKLGSEEPVREKYWKEVEPEWMVLQLSSSVIQAAGGIDALHSMELKEETLASAAD